jgi:formylglycine-generating enzyme required for sulfatase activity
MIMKNTIKYFGIIVLVVVVGFTMFACGDRFDSGQYGTVTINLGGSGRSAMDWPPTDSMLKEMKYKIVFTQGSTVETFNISGESSFRVSVKTGNWRVLIEAFYEGKLYAKGTTSVVVKPYQQNNAKISMYPAFDDGGGGEDNGDTPTTYTITMQNDGNGTANADKQSAAQGTKVTIAAMPNNGYKFQQWEIVNGGVTLSDTYTSPAEFIMPARNITIKALFEALPPDTPNLALDPSTITFDDTTFGYTQPEARSIEIKNTGTGTATVSNISLNDVSSFTLSGHTGITTITAGSSVNFYVQPNAGLNAGMYSAVITVTYDGGRTATMSTSFTVNKADQTTLSIVDPGIKDNTDVPFTLSTTGGSTAGAVSYTVTTGTDVINISGSTVTILNAGTATVTATKAGDDNYNPVTSAPITIIVSVVHVSIIETVWINPGTFTMGSPSTEATSINDERPQHLVTLTKGFYMGKYPVTQDQYEAVMGVNPSYFSSNPALGEVQGRRPVEQVTWFDAIEFCNKLSELEGFDPVYTITGRTPLSGYPITNATVTADFSKNGYRLPTEAQWEYACRAGTTTAYNTGGDTISENTGWYATNSGNRTHEVGKKPANAWGLYDMHGNVYEWCWDWHDYYTDTAKIDPEGVSSGSNRVRRGGTWFNTAQYHRSAYRGICNPSDRDDDTGFRVLRP